VPAFWWRFEQASFCCSGNRGRVAHAFVVLVNLYVYKLVVIVNAPAFVDKSRLLHKIKGLPRR
jgi:hypothetical protein